MPIRMLRDWTRSEKILLLSVHAERFFVRLIMKADDYGCYDANPVLLKADLFPFLSDKIREADVVRWTAECLKADLIVLYESGGKKYLQIKEFRQRLDKARNKYPLPGSAESLTVVNDFPAETETEEEEETEAENTGATPSSPPAPDPLTVFEGMEKNKNSLAAFIRQYRPDFIEPYVDLWNFFADEREKARIIKISDSRRKKFKTRYHERAFDFVQILSKAGKADDFLSTSKWFTWDWIMDSEGNYLKVLEGNYGDKKKSSVASAAPMRPALSKDQEELNFLYGRFLEDPLAITVISIDPDHYNFLKKSDMIHFSQEETAWIRELAIEHITTVKLERKPEIEIRFMKKFGVLEFFKQLKKQAQETVFTHVKSLTAQA